MSRLTNSGPPIGKQRATVNLADDMAAYDNLPPALRVALANAAADLACIPSAERLRTGESRVRDEIAGLLEYHDEHFGPAWRPAGGAPWFVRKGETR